MGTWKAVKSEEGLQQGSPLACFAAALGGVKCILAARNAMDEFHALSREAPATMSDQQKEAVYKLAATASEATLYTVYYADSVRIPVRTGLFCMGNTVRLLVPDSRLDFRL